MSAVLDTVNAFANTLQTELAKTVIDQEQAAVDALAEISTKISDARTEFLTNLTNIEDTFSATVKAATVARSNAMREAGAHLDSAVTDCINTIEEVKARYA